MRIAKVLSGLQISKVKFEFWIVKIIYRLLYLILSKVYYKPEIYEMENLSFFRY